MTSLDSSIIFEKIRLSQVDSASPANIISFLETSVKKIIKYSINFNLISLKEIINEEKMSRIFSGLNNNYEAFTLNAELIKNIMRFFKINISSKKGKWIDEIYKERNRLSHLNGEVYNLRDYKDIFLIVNNLKNIILSRYKNIIDSKYMDIISIYE